MQFYPYEALDENKAHNKLWDWLKEAFNDDPGVAYYRYPVFKKSGDLLKEPDVVFFHREYGLWIIECKGCTIGNIRGIQGHVWEMYNWYREQESPLIQAEDQMFAIQNKLNSQRELRGKVVTHFRVALPKVERSQWQEKGFNQYVEGAVWLYEDLTPAALKRGFAAITKDNPQSLDEETWELACKVLGGTLPRKEPRIIPTGTASTSPLRVINEIESGLKALDSDQQQVAFQVPDGPQRLRGLAGTGKTVLLAKRAAKIHIKHPDWTIGFVFFTRSLYDQIIELITLYCHDLGDCDPNWRKLKVLHSWGGRSQDGFYYDLARQVRVSPLNLDNIREQISQNSPSQGFEYICLSLVQQCLQQGNYSLEQISKIHEIENLDYHDILESSDMIQEALIEAEDRNLNLIPKLYDVLLVDEGQDLPAIFYKLLLAALREPKRLYWAYDEAQGIGSSIIPSADKMFGRNAEGKSRVDVTSKYPGNILKSHKIYRCYRTPRLLLMTAHALNMGLMRQEGPLQGVTQQRGWNDLGYTITAGDFSSSSVARRDKVTITRDAEASPHPIDQDTFKNKDALGDILCYQTFRTEKEEQEWVANQVKRDLELGFKPEDIFITALSGDHERNYLRELKRILESVDIPAYIAGVETLPGQRFPSPHIFRLQNKVTIANIFRAKGNEAWKVYVCRFHYANRPLEWKGETELEKRNEAFVGLTRARVWSVVTGLEDDIFDELEAAISTPPNLTFTAFSQRTLKRSIDDEE